jgi:hypothetical protein
VWSRPVALDLRLCSQIRRSSKIGTPSLKLAVARLAFGWRLAGGGAGDVIGVLVPVCTFEDVLVHIRIPRRLIRD